VTTGLVGTAQAGNVAVALTMLRAAGGRWLVTLDEAAETLPNVRLPGRFQTVGRYILDVAHNPDGMRSFVETLRKVSPPGPVTAVFGVLADKDWRQMLTTLSEVVSKVVLVAPPSAPPQRAWHPEEALSFATAAGIDASYEPDFAGAVKSAPLNGGTALITGSFHTVGDALIVLGESTL
jgi:dihydrofolate synthase/folylpolyglutamate synthase